MEQREAERAAKTRIPTAFSLPNVGKSFANFQRGSARLEDWSRLLSVHFILWVGCGGGVSLRGRARPFYGFRQSRNGPRTSASAPRWKEQHRNFPPPASHCSTSSSRVSPLFYCPTLSLPSPFPATNPPPKKPNKTGVKCLKRGRTRRKGRRRQRCAPLPSFASL